MYNSLENFKNDWDAESKSTLKLFGAITENSLSQKVYDEGRTMGDIAWHIVETLFEMPAQAGLRSDPKIPAKYESRNVSELLDAYQSGYDSFMELVLSNWNDSMLPGKIEMYGQEWSRAETLYGMLKHEIHHRAQLTILMRQAGLKVPGVYGPSKEEWSLYGMEPMK